MPRPVPPPVTAQDIPPDERPSQYPPLFQGRMAGRIKRRLGDHFDLRNFGVNLTTLLPGVASAMPTAVRTNSSSSSKARPPSTPTTAL